MFAATGEFASGLVEVQLFAYHADPGQMGQAIGDKLK